jgi:hypothetical protein
MRKVPPGMNIISPAGALAGPSTGLAVGSEITITDLVVRVQATGSIVLREIDSINAKKVEIGDGIRRAAA